MSLDIQTLVDRCLCERREARINALVRTLQSIADDGPEKKPRPQKGSDDDVLLAYEDGYADASYEAALGARQALAEWETGYTPPAPHGTRLA